MLSTNAPLSASGSAAQQSRTTDKDHSTTFVKAMEADRARPRLRMVAGGAPAGEVLARDWARDWDEDQFEDQFEDPQGPPEARTEARLDDGGSKAPFLAVVENGAGESRRKSASHKHDRSEPRRKSLKKLNSRQIAQDWPPAPRGCEWRRSDDGLNLWRCWTDWDDDKTRKIRKSRYAGHLSDDAWRIMKEYDHEAFISIVGERLRRHGGR
jgi:hypothetical protein